MAAGNIRVEDLVAWLNEQAKVLDVEKQALLAQHEYAGPLQELDPSFNFALGKVAASEALLEALGRRLEIESILATDSLFDSPPGATPSAE